jgi:hypothetical protein
MVGEELGICWVQYPSCKSVEQELTNELSMKNHNDTYYNRCSRPSPDVKKDRVIDKKCQGTGCGVKITSKKLADLQ